MRGKNSLLIISGLLFLAASIPSSGEKVTLIPVDDTFVWKDRDTVYDAYPTADRGDIVLLVSGLKTGFVKFDLRPFASITSAIYSGYWDNENGGVNVLKVTDDSWSEKTLTYFNMPELGDKIGFLDNQVKKTRTKLDVTAYAKEEAGDFISFAMTADGTKNRTMFQKECGEERRFCGYVKLEVTGEKGDVSVLRYKLTASDIKANKQVKKSDKLFAVNGQYLGSAQKLWQTGSTQNVLVVKSSDRNFRIFR